MSHINSDLATFIRTCVILLTLALIVYATGQFENPTSIAPRTYLFLVLSGLATGASWLCYFRALKLGNASQVAPVDKLSVVLVAIFGALLLGEKLTMLNWLGVALIALALTAWLGAPYLPAQLVTTGIVLFWSFLANRVWTFGRS